MANVKCPVCLEYFNRDKCEWEHYKNRYYHKECYKQIEEEDRMVQEIHEKMRMLLGSDYSQQKVNRQINALVKEGKTKKGIKLTLDYWYDIKGSDPSKAAGGIGIVSYIYAEAQNYWEKKEWLSSRNKDVDLSCYSQPIIYKIKPTPITKPKRVKLFSLD